MHNRMVHALMAAGMLLFAACGARGPVAVESPDGAISMVINHQGGPDASSLVYSIDFNGRPVIADSPLGIGLTGNVTLAENCVITRVEKTHADETYDVAAGKSSQARNRYNGAIITYSSPDGAVFAVEARVFDDGVAFRYSFPEQAGLNSLDIAAELTSFAFTGDHRYWGLHLPNYTTSYESDYTVSALSEISPDRLTALPLLIKVSDTAWAAVTEADLTEYAGMYLRGDESNPHLLTASLSPLPDEPGMCVHTAIPAQTPWRVVMLADSPDRFIESNIVLNLNDPPAFDPSWVNPGKSAWDWWNGQIVEGGDFAGGMDNRTMKHFIDFAGEMGFDYMLVDAGWYPRFGDVGDSEADGDITRSIPAIDVPELVAYGEERGVGIFLWLHWTPVDRDMDKAFPLYEQWGVKGVKIDFMDRDDQEMVDFYHRVCRTAADHHLHVDFHGAYKPTGIRRTYPNLLTREGVLGLEYNKWSERVTPGHDCILPYTRMLAGPMDYTPGGFTNATRETFVARNDRPMVQGTRCHQLGLLVVIESPFQCIADYPANYRGQPGVQFVRDVPASWDETRVIRGEVGGYVFIARRKGEEWYLGGITDWTARSIPLPLEFLGEGDYAAEIYADGPAAERDAEDTVVSHVVYSGGDTYNARLAPGGGVAIRFTPLR